MMKLSRGAWIAIAAVAAIPAGIAVAKTSEHGGWHRMSPEARQRLDEGKIAMAKTALKLSAEQEKLWEPLEAQARTFLKDRQDKMAERKKMRDERKAEKKADNATDSKDTAAVKRPDMAERFEKMSQNMSERAERMKAFSASFKPFYASLSDEQKEVLKPLVRELAPSMGGRGHKGKRWAHGGGWGGHGKGGHHGGGWGGRHGGDNEGRRGGDRGGPVMDDAGPDDGADDAGAKPAAPAEQK